MGAIDPGSASGPVGRVADARGSRVREDPLRGRVGTPPCRVGPRAQDRARGADPSGCPRRHDRGRVRHPQRQSGLGPAQVRGVEATADVEERRDSARVLQPRAGPAARSAVRLGMVRRARGVGVPARDVGQPDAEPAAWRRSEVRCDHDSEAAPRAARASGA